MAHKGDFLKTLNFLQTMATFRPCPDCAKKGIVSPIVPRRITEDVAIWKCNSQTCIYPMSQSFEFFKAQFVPVCSIDERLFCRYVHYDVRSECGSDSVTCSSLSNDDSETANGVKEAWKTNNNDSVNGLFRSREHVGNDLGGQTGHLGGQARNLDGQTGTLGGQAGNLGGQTGNLGEQTGNLGGQAGNLGGQAGNFVTSKQYQDSNNGLSFITNAFVNMDEGNNYKNSQNNRKRGPPSILGDSALNEQQFSKRPSSRCSAASVKERKEMNKSTLNLLRFLNKKAPTPTSSASSVAPNQASIASKFGKEDRSGLDKEFVKTSKLAKNLFSTTPSNSASFDPISLSSAAQQQPKVGNRKNFPGYVSRGLLNNAAGSETKSEDDLESVKRGLSVGRSTLSPAVKRTILNNLKGVIGAVTGDSSFSGQPPCCQNTPPTSVVQYEKSIRGGPIVTQTAPNWQPNVSSSSEYDFLDPFSTDFGLTDDQKPSKDLRPDSSTSDFYSQEAEYNFSTPIAAQSMFVGSSSDCDPSNLFDYTPNFEESPYLTSNPNIMTDNGLDYQQL